MEETARQRRSARNREAIIAEARRLIVAEGIAGFSLRELARQVDYSAAGLYRYFKSKDEIIDAIGSEAMVGLGAFMSRVPSTSEPLKRLTELGYAYLDFAADDPGLFVNILTVMPGRATSWADIDHPQSPFHMLEDSVRAAIERGDIATGPGTTARSIAYSCWGLVHGLAVLTHTTLRNIDQDFRAANRAAVRHFVTSLSTAAGDETRRKQK